MCVSLLMQLRSSKNQQHEDVMENNANTIMGDGREQEIESPNSIQEEIPPGGPTNMDMERMFQIFLLENRRRDEYLTATVRKIYVY